MFFDLHHNCERARWTRATLKRPLGSLDLDKSLQLQKIINRWSRDLDLDQALVDGLVTMITAFIDSNGVELGEFVLRARTIDESFTLLARKIAQELFRVLSKFFLKI